MINEITTEISSIFTEITNEMHCKKITKMIELRT